jgi:hypothetical protein
MESCPITGGTTVSGPASLDCTGQGQCELSADCKLQQGREEVGGQYVSELTGNYEVPEGCTVTCTGCSEHQDSGASSLGMVGALSAAVIVQFLLI